MGTLWLGKVSKPPIPQLSGMHSLIFEPNDHPGSIPSSTFSLSTSSSGPGRHLYRILEQMKNHKCGQVVTVIMGVVEDVDIGV